MSFSNLALMAQKMLQAANMGQSPTNFNSNVSNGSNFTLNGNGYGNLSPNSGLIGPGDRNHPGNLQNG